MKNRLLKIIRRQIDKVQDRRYNVSTMGQTKVNYASADMLPYAPVSYGAIKYALSRLPIRPDKSHLLDIGCGKGRALIVGASMGFRFISGIEVIPELANEARRNLSSMRGMRKNVSAHVGALDAAKSAIPDTVNVIYFFNPFRGELLRAVIANIVKSVDRHPRQLFIVYFNNDHFEKEISDNERIMEFASPQVVDEDISLGFYFVTPRGPK